MNWQIALSWHQAKKANPRRVKLCSGDPPTSFTSITSSILLSTITPGMFIFGKEKRHTRDATQLENLRSAGGFQSRASKTLASYLRLFLQVSNNRSWFFQYNIHHRRYLPSNSETSYGQAVLRASNLANMPSHPDVCKYLTFNSCQDLLVPAQLFDSNLRSAFNTDGSQPPRPCI